MKVTRTLVLQQIRLTILVPAFVVITLFVVLLFVFLLFVFLMLVVFVEQERRYYFLLHDSC